MDHHVTVQITGGVNCTVCSEDCLNEVFKEFQSYLTSKRVKELRGSGDAEDQQFSFGRVVGYNQGISDQIDALMSGMEEHG